MGKGMLGVQEPPDGGQKRQRGWDFSWASPMEDGGDNGHHKSLPTTTLGCARGRLLVLGGQGAGAGTTLSVDVSVTFRDQLRTSLPSRFLTHRILPH